MSECVNLKVWMSVGRDSLSAVQRFEFRFRTLILSRTQSLKSDHIVSFDVDTSHSALSFSQSSSNRTPPKDILSSGMLLTIIFFSLNFASWASILTCWLMRLHLLSLWFHHRDVHIQIEGLITIQSLIYDSELVFDDFFNFYSLSCTACNTSFRGVLSFVDPLRFRSRSSVGLVLGKFGTSIAFKSECQCECKKSTNDQ